MYSVLVSLNYHLDMNRSHLRGEASIKESLRSDWLGTTSFRDRLEY